VKGISVFQHDYTVTGCHDYVLRIDAPNVVLKAYTMKIACDFIFEEMKHQYDNMSYLKVSVLVPSRKICNNI
jgi:uncharacterized protein YacL (UPF0231 family)